MRKVLFLFVSLLLLVLTATVALATLPSFATPQDDIYNFLPTDDPSALCYSKSYDGTRFTLFIYVPGGSSSFGSEEKSALASRLCSKYYGSSPEYCDYYEREILPLNIGENACVYALNPDDCQACVKQQTSIQYLGIFLTVLGITAFFASLIYLFIVLPVFYAFKRRRLGPWWFVLLAVLMLIISTFYIFTFTFV
jgi:hypothetical protein